MTDLVVARSRKTGRWIKGRFSAGVCSTLRWDDLEKLLKNINRVREDEHVDRFEIAYDGITFFIEPND